MKLCVVITFMGMCGYKIITSDVPGCVTCTYVCAPYTCSIHREWKEVSDSLGMEIETIVNHAVYPTDGRAASALPHWAIFSSRIIIFYDKLIDKMLRKY